MHQSLQADGRGRTRRAVEEKLLWLGRVEIFSALEAEELRTVASECAFYSFKKDEPVFNEGDPGDSLYLVTQGLVEIAQKTATGGTAVVAELLTGDTFGELELLTSAPRNAAAVAREDSRLLAFPRRGHSFARVLEKFPEVSAKLLFVFLKTVAGRMRRTNALIKENSPWVQELRRQVYGDKLSGLYNKTFLEEHLPGLLLDPAQPVSLLMVKPDNFKYINDTHGHEAGDRALRLMAQTLGGLLGPQDLAARYMGNELSAVLVGAGRLEAEKKAEEIRSSFNALDLRDIVGEDPVRLSVSLGIACYPEHAAGAEALIEAAHALPLVGRARGGNLILFPEDA